MFTLIEGFEMRGDELSDIRIMFEFIQLRNRSDKLLAAYLRLSSLEDTLNHGHYEDAFYKLTDIYCTLKSMELLKSSEYQGLTELLSILERRATA